ncbi:MAG: twin-arginine translocation pathway signal protein [Burkholderiales bacterium]|nr:twin-arginine translocation pathway signal protein [Burkholderiales bacterium]
MDRRLFIRLLGGGVVTAATAGTVSGCSSDLPSEALAAWRGPGQPPAPGTDPRHWLLAHAILAPHSHNLQSWLVDLRQPDRITLYCDRSRLLPETDPFSRQMMMSQGTFLELLDLAARQLGLRADIQLFPQGEFGPAQIDQRPTALITLLPDASIRPDPLFQQVFKRRTNREAYEAREPAAEALAAIAASGVAPNTATGFVGGAQPTQRDQHRQIAMDAWRIELETPRTILESYRYLRIGPSEINAHRDGIAINQPFVRAVTALGLFDRSKAPAPGDSNMAAQMKAFNAKLATTPAFFWLTTQGNSRSTQVLAGRAYARAQLAATAHGLSMHPLQQALQEYPEQAQPYAAIHQLLEAPVATHTVQMWARLGYAPPVAPAPRRGVAAHVLTA